jgi:hypothetical protein
MESRHHDGTTLCDATRMWMTPTARDHKDGATSLANTPVNGLLGRQVLTMASAGSDISDARRSLNPLFVEALMGWPSGWTGFGSVATVWSPWLRRMRSELSRLNCWPTPLERRPVWRVQESEVRRSPGIGPRSSTHNDGRLGCSD